MCRVEKSPASHFNYSGSPLKDGTELISKNNRRTTGDFSFAFFNLGAFFTDFTLPSFGLTAHQMATPNAPVAVSAPGKVLLAGGYLVLDQLYTGLVFGLSARINVITQESSGQDNTGDEIVVDSPQFLQAQWRYSYTVLGEGGGVKVTQSQRYALIAEKISVFINLVH